jgi:hypothetical protein
MANIQEFIANMSKAGGFAFEAQYEMTVIPPTKLDINNSIYIANGEESTSVNINKIKHKNALGEMSEVRRQLTLQCTSVQMPGHTLQTQSRQYGSEPGREMVQTHEYAGTIKATFLLSRDLREKHFFEQWQALAVDNYTHKANYYDDYIGAITIVQLSSVSQGVSSFLGTPLFAQEATYGIVATEVFPKVVGGIEYSAKSKNSIASLDVDFEFKQWFNLGDVDQGFRPFSQGFGPNT